METVLDTHGALPGRLRDALGDVPIDTDPVACRLFAQDVFAATAPVLAIARPRHALDVQVLVYAARTHKLILIPRGGGMSYTGGYLSPNPARTIAIDLQAMNRIIEINEQDMFVTVEPGCTWAALQDALGARGLRPAYWGPLSGLRATIGGTISQNGILWGAGLAGSSADSVLGLEVVTGNGDIIVTGSGGVADASPFFRHFGPDLTGLFTSDCGALGIKTRIVLRLVTARKVSDALSFTTGNHADLATLLSAVSRRGLAAQQMAMDAPLREARMVKEGLWTDLGHFYRLLRTAVQRRAGFVGALRVALAGRRPGAGAAFSAHIFMEADSTAELAATAAAIRAIAAQANATEIEASVPRLLSAQPFGPLNGMLGPNGKRWVPVHCIVPHSRAQAAFDAIAAIFAAHAGEFERHGISTGFLFTTIASNGYVIEPMFLWPDELHALHRDAIAADRLARYGVPAAAPEARALVAAVRKAVTEAVDRLGAVHIQIGRHYPYRARLDTGARRTFDQVRELLDPDGVINPGVLG